MSYFFVLSGFIMAVVCRSRFTAAGSASQYWPARIARIYPVYLLALAVVLTLTNWHSFLSIGLTAALVQAWSHLVAPSLVAKRTGPVWPPQ